MTTTEDVHGERGAMAISLIAVVVMVVLVVLVAVTLPALSVTDNKTGAQTAADAAALAGADGALELTMADLEDVTLGDIVGGATASATWSPFDGPLPMAGYGDAQRYAQKNDASLEPDGYSYDAWTGTTYARVRANEEPAAGERSVAHAEAQLGIDLSTCRITANRDELPVPSPSPKPTPSGTPSPSASPTPTEPPEPEFTPWELEFECEGMPSVTGDGADLGGFLHEVRDALEVGLTPRLVG